MIANYTQKLYINRISSSLPLFKWTSSKAASFRCILCGDSKKSKTKKRGTIYEFEGEWRYKCHNCGESMYFTTFMKENFNELYREMLLESMKGTKADNISYIVEKKQEEAKNWECVLTSLKDLGPQHEAAMYVKNRRIPIHQFDRIYYTDNFAETYYRLCKLFNITPEDKHVPSMRAILFPFLDKENNLMFIQGRFIDDNAVMRYLTVRFLDASKIFGLETLNINQDVFVFEGAIDSFFISNSVATADADLTRAIQYIDKSKLVLVYDNEPRSKIACRKIENALKSGFKVVIFPERIIEKDINDMFLSNLNVQELVENNIHQGMMGLLKFQKWKKC
jgi:hypothetical protein